MLPAVRLEAVDTELIDEPLVNLSADATSAQGRWMSLALRGDGRGRAWFEGGSYENDYVREAAIWKIAAVHYFPLFAGDYADGWINAGGGDLGRMPFHFTPDDTGTPVPAATGPAPATGSTLAAVRKRIDALNDEDAVRNLQNAFGYYVDRRMWDDVVDLFATDCAVELGGQLRRGPAGVRAAMAVMGPAGLTHGVLNEHPLFDTIVAIRPGGREAESRGIELAMLGDADQGAASWQVNVFRNRFVNDDGIWKFAELRVYPLMDAQYATGWGDGALPGQSTPMLVDFLGPNPVTGQPVATLDYSVAAAEPLVAVTPAVPAVPSIPSDDLADARRRYSRSLAYEGTDNVSAAYGYYIDDFQWPQLADIMAREGNKQSPFAGYYLGRDRIRGAATAMWGEPPPMRSAISFHWRTQSVIHVSHDGRSANLRTRLFQPRTAKDPTVTPIGFYMGGLHGGMYPNDQAVLEDGVWRLWSLTIDEHYFYMPTWKAGWSGARDPEPGTAARPSPLLSKYPPDILLTDLGRRQEGFRGGTGTTIDWPGILPMWFCYRNPVSGRVPERYWPDCVPSEKVPEASLTRHGYQMPPTGPEVDGLDRA